MAEAPGGGQHAALAVASRRRLLHLLQSGDDRLDAAALATQVGLHVTTARFHLDVLERAGLVRREVELAARPGRPRQLYSAVPVPPVGEGHRELAAVLAEGLASDVEHGPQRAAQAGRQWAEQLAPTADGLSWEDGTRQVGELFDQLGFAPRLVDDAQHRHLELDRCPFRDVARIHPQIVCTVHLGLLRGALQRVQPSAVAERAALRPFVGPQLCIADIPVPPHGEQHPARSGQG